MFVCYWDLYTWNDGKRWPDPKSGPLPSYTKSGRIGLNPARTTATTPYDKDLLPSAIALAVLKCVCLVMNRSRHFC